MNCFGFALIIGFMTCNPTLQPSPSQLSFCEVYHPQIWRPSWPKDAKDQADEYNRKWVALCHPPNKGSIKK